MKDRKLVRRVLLIAMVAMLFMSVGLARAQGPDMDEQPVNVSAVTGAVGTAFTYQGRITYNGLPYDTRYDLRFRLFGVPSGGSQIGPTKYYSNYLVSRGLFTVALDFGGAAFQGDSRWLEISVRPWNSSGSYTVMAPRQAVRVVPYALSLRPGAGILGSVSGRSVLHIENSDSHTGAAGLYAEASNSSTILPTYGVRGISNSSHGVGVQGYSSRGQGVVGESRTGVGVVAKSGYDNILEGWDTHPSNVRRFYVSNGGSLYASGSISSGRTTRWAVSPLKMVPNTSLQVWPDPSGYVGLRPSAAGYRYAYLPVDVPSNLFGTPIKLYQVHFCYNADNTSDYITEFNVRYLRDDGHYATLINSTANYTSASWHCQTLTDSTPSIINGALFLRFKLYFSGSGSSHDFRIGNIYLTLSE